MQSYFLQKKAQAQTQSQEEIKTEPGIVKSLSILNSDRSTWRTEDFHRVGRWTVAAMWSRQVQMLERCSIEKHFQKERPWTTELKELNLSWGGGERIQHLAPNTLYVCNLDLSCLVNLYGREKGGGWAKKSLPVLKPNINQDTTNFSDIKIEFTARLD